MPIPSRRRRRERPDLSIPIGAVPVACGGGSGLAVVPVEAADGASNHELRGHGAPPPAREDRCAFG